MDRNYDGNFIEPHKIQPGESLSLIARKYRFAHWKPIWIYNTQVQGVLGPDPNRIPAGQQILIPRSKQGYENLLRKLRSLKDQVAGMGDQVKYDLEGEYDKHQAARVLFDLAGDIATTIGTFAVKAANAARAAKTAAATRGQARVAAQYLADKQARELATDLTRQLSDQVVNAALTKVDKDLGAGHKDLYLTQRKGVSAVRGVSLQGGKSFLDIADILLDYVSVSKVADGMLLLTMGETPGQSYRNAQQHVKQSVQHSQTALDQKIHTYNNERALLYRSG